VRPAAKLGRREPVPDTAYARFNSSGFPRSWRPRL